MQGRARVWPKCGRAVRREGAQSEGEVTRGRRESRAEGKKQGREFELAARWRFEIRCGAQRGGFRARTCSSGTLGTGFRSSSYSRSTVPLSLSTANLCGDS